MDDNTPVPFGYKIGWLALSTTDRAAVVHSLQLVDPTEVSWQNGINAAYGNARNLVGSLLGTPEKVFISPPIDGWTLVVGWPMGTSADDQENIREVEQLVTRLSQEFGEAQAFATHRVADYHQWILARNGALVRSFAIVGAELLADVGEPTPVEREFGWYPLCLDEEDPDDEETDWPDEQDVMRVAAAWSIDPTQLGPATASSGRGVIATAPCSRRTKQEPQGSPERRPWWRFW